VAYVLDPDKTFEQRCNMSMVELQPIPEEEELAEKTEHEKGDLETPGIVSITSRMDRNDAKRLRELLKRHHRYTGSTKAKEILDHWKQWLPRFVKVMPTEYARALAEMEKAQAAAELKRSA
jgi:glutamate synthase (NADPH/NADH) large chain